MGNSCYCLVWEKSNAVQCVKQKSVAGNKSYERSSLKRRPMGGETSIGEPKICGHPISRFLIVWCLYLACNTTVGVVGIFLNTEIVPPWFPPVVATVVLSKLLAYSLCIYGVKTRSKKLLLASGIAVLVLSLGQVAVNVASTVWLSKLSEDEFSRRVLKSEKDDAKDSENDIGTAKTVIVASSGVFALLPICCDGPVVWMSSKYAKYLANSGKTRNEVEKV